MDTSDFVTINNYWFDRMLQDCAFVYVVVERYRELRKSSLSDEHIQEILDDSKESLENTAERNCARWGYTFDTKLLPSFEWRK